MSTASKLAPHTLVVGLGKTGLSVVRHLRARGLGVAVLDTRAAPPALAALRAEAPEVAVHTGELDLQRLAGAMDIVISPGLAPRGEFFEAARARGLPVIGDIELFARAAEAMGVAISSNKE